MKCTEFKFFLSAGLMFAWIYKMDFTFINVTSVQSIRFGRDLMCLKSKAFPSVQSPRQLPPPSPADAVNLADLSLVSPSFWFLADLISKYQSLELGLCPK